MLVDWQAPLASALLLSRIVKLHYNWKYPFLQPSITEIIERYNLSARPHQGRAAERGGGALLVISSISLIVMPALRVVSPSQRCQHLVRTASQDRSIKSTPCEA